MTYLNYDSSGFVVGVNRMRDGIDNVHDDTQEIIQILKSQNQIANTRMGEIARAIQDDIHQKRTTGMSRANSSRKTNDGLPASKSTSNKISARPSDRAASQSPSNTPSNSDSARPKSTDSSDNNSSTANRDSGKARRSRAASNSDSVGADTDRAIPKPTDTASSSTPTKNRERDANGRFVSGDGDGASGGDTKDKSMLSKLASAIGGMRGGGDNVDPFLESFKEAKDLLAPLGRGAKMLGGGVKVGLSKVRSLKRREPLPQEQTNHNRENEKLLDKIWQAILKSGKGGGGGGGLLGGIIPLGKGGGIKKALKALTGTPGKIIAGIMGSMALASNWDKLGVEEKGAGVGEIAGGIGGAAAGGLAGAAIGSVVPVVGTIIGGLVGAGIGGWLGSDAGTVLGANLSPKIDKWTDSLKSFNLPAKMQATWDRGTKPIFTRLAEAAKSWLQKGYDFITGNGSGNSGDSGSNGEYASGDITGAVSQKADKAADVITENALTKSSGYCARYVRKGLQSVGYDLKTVGDAKNYDNGALTDAGFSKIDKGSAPMKGDVMVMPAQQGSKKNHSAGHMQIYNGTQWVSDFKQNSMNPWGDVKQEDLKYTHYRDLKGQKTAGGGSSGGKGGKGGSREKQAMDYFTGQGWTKEQAAGIVGNFHKETGGFAEDVISGKRKGDSGKAVGIGQWHPDRQQDFKKAFGKNLAGASFEDQLKFAQYELTKGKEQSAGNKLKKANTAAQAGAVVSEFYERPKAKQAEKKERGQIAERISKQYAQQPTKTPDKAPDKKQGKEPDKKQDKAPTKPAPEQKEKGLLESLGFGGKTLLAAGNSFGATPSRLPAVASLVVPNAPKITDRVDSGANKPIVLQASNDTINQNVSDRGLAHAITGGLGQDRYWG